MLSLEDRKKEIETIFDRLTSQYFIPLCMAYDKEFTRWIKHCDPHSYDDIRQLITEMNNLFILLLGQAYATVTFNIYKDTQDQELMQMLKDKFAEVVEEAWSRARFIDQQAKSEAIN